MKPPRFRYESPASAAEAVQLLAQHGEDARPLAGGQSLVPMMNFRLVAPACLVDLNRIDALSFIAMREGALAIGAMTRQAAIEDSDLVARHCPLLAEAVRFVAHRQIRNRGTVGGSLALAYPGAELPAVVLTLDGEITVLSAAGERRIPARDFFKGPMATDLRPGELIAAIRLRPMADDCTSAFVEVSRRHGDFALAAAAVLVQFGRHQAVVSVRIGVTGATAVPIRAARAESMLVGRRLDPDVIAAAAQRAAGEIEPLSDAHYPADYRRQLAFAVVKRGLSLAAQRAGARHVA